MDTIIIGDEYEYYHMKGKANITLIEHSMAWIGFFPNIVYILLLAYRLEVTLTCNPISSNSSTLL